jgi:hypothetical protein
VWRGIDKIAIGIWQKGDGECVETSNSALFRTKIFQRKFAGNTFLRFAYVTVRLEQRNKQQSFHRNGEQTCTFGGIDK